MNITLPSNAQKTALKEWASVCEALSTGRQLLLFRKGGIIEKNDQFELEKPEFFLYPTFLHQDEKRLQTGQTALIEQSQKYEIDPQHVRVTLYCKAEKVYQAKHIESLCLHPEWYIWNSQHIQDTWQWKPEKPAYIILVRAYHINPAFIVKNHPSYGGCVSWIDIQETIPEMSLQPVIDDEKFNQLAKEIDKALETQLAVFN